MSATTTFPTDGDKLREQLADAETIKTHFGDPETAAKYIEGVVAAMNTADQGDVAEQIQVETQRQITAMMRENGYEQWTGPTPQGADGPMTGFNPHGYNPEALGAKLDTELDIRNLKLKGQTGVDRSASFGHIVAASWYDQPRLPQLAHLNGVRDKLVEITNAYSSNLGSGGGFLVPEQFRSELMRMALEQSIVRQRARVFPMASASLTLPAIDVTSHASSLFGGVVTYWTAEAASMTSSEAKFQVVKLEPDTLTGLATIPDQLIADTAFLDAYFSSTFPPAMNYTEDEAFLVGNGVGKPLGAFKGAGTVIVPAEGGQTADTVVWENIVNMFARLPATSMSSAVWVVNQTCIPQLLTMTFSGVPVMIQEGGGPSAPTYRMLGLPVLISEKVSTLGDEGDINLVDLDFYLIGDRQAMTVDSSNAQGFRENTTDFKVVERVDGRPWVQTALTPRNGADTLSPYLRLAARA